MPKKKPPIGQDLSKGLSRHQWAWEFVRRNPDYLALTRPFRRPGARFLNGEFYGCPERVKTLEEKFYLGHAVDPAIPGESISTDHWHHNYVAATMPVVPHASIGNYSDVKCPVFGDCYTLTVFSQNISLEERVRLFTADQIKRGAKKRPNVKVAPFSKLKFYLMAYDLRQQHGPCNTGQGGGISEREIAEELMPGRSTHRAEDEVANALKQAREYIQGKYKKLLLSAPTELTGELGPETPIYLKTL